MYMLIAIKKKNMKFVIDIFSLYMIDLLLNRHYFNKFWQKIMTFITASADLYTTARCQNLANVSQVM